MRKDAEPPSTNRPSAANFFYIGRNSRGAWVVQDQSGLRGGLFIDRSEALRFALFENGRRPQAVLMVPDVVELDFNRVANDGQPKIGTPIPLERKVA
ncbi:MAG: hypothetical protein JOZ94_12115 [Xanthobacteraceae bacterium]|nr:hypothetical protein [Xanthobacteraceae bacterium]MBV9236570.1 hypothetical protein [Xanthobacteraceae bacterium]MBV9632213.1 hypothetical protein [Xanthobacteraceae bacterium]